jgi:uncharacterized DUF497 family protein
VFSWDPRKAIGNLRKHGVSFEEAATVFSDLEGLDWDDFEHSLSERRSTRLNNGKETIRIISTRQATRKERQAYAG